MVRTTKPAVGSTSGSLQLLIILPDNLQKLTKIDGKAAQLAQGSSRCDVLAMSGNQEPQAHTTVVQTI